jgi:large subunit ribosomal protein L1
MAKRGKRYEKARGAVERHEVFSLIDALKQVKELASVKFDESVDVDINLGVDPSKSDQGVKGSVILPHGRGGVPRVIVFARGEYAEQAEKAGADVVGEKDLVDKIQSGWIEFDYAVATPEVMGLVGKLAKVLGPRGLLPNKRLGTVTFDVGKIVSELKGGRVFFKSDKGGSVHFTLGKVSHEAQSLDENLRAFLKNLLAAKPPSAKGKYLKKMVISSTMGIGVPVNVDELLHK